MKFVQKLQILCNTEVLIFTIFHYIIVIQASFTNSSLNSSTLTVGLWIYRTWISA